MLKKIWFIGESDGSNDDNDNVDDNENTGVDNNGEDEYDYNWDANEDNDEDSEDPGLELGGDAQPLEEMMMMIWKPMQMSPMTSSMSLPLEKKTCWMILFSMLMEKRHLQRTNMPASCVKLLERKRNLSAMAT
jgi:hypothetical protein